ncbi:MAG: GNAT family N-acetyltransferase [Clostridia bacterium]|nr:GNAT family N-acetyltransferase [Clostridia bacterium]
MKYITQYTTDFSDTAFQAAFRVYFGELGCRVTNWDGLFAAMSETGREYTWTNRDHTGRMTRFVSGVDAEERDHAFTLRDETGSVVGFIQFTAMHLDSWFFNAKCGFIREFWMRADLRRQGHGSALLHLAEDWLREQGCLCVLLTTVTAPGFYCKHGYTHQAGIEARNQEAVFTKMLTE